MAKHIYSRLLFGLIAGALCAGLAGCGGGTHSDHAHASGDPAPPYTIDAGSTIYDFKAKNIDGWPTPLSRYEGKVLLVVNVASECRFTHQYDNLQRLYMKYKDRGLVVLGFPTNDFGRQEPGTNAEIKEFVSFQYNIMFPMFSKISVKGERMHPVYQCLTGPETGGAFAGPITWNFNKFLIDRNGKTIARFDSETDPLDPEITEAIEAAL